MRTAWGIFLHDLKKLVTNPLALIVAIAIILVPSACAWCSIGAMWNPSSHTANLKVAVVSEDEGVPIDSIKVNGVDAGAIAGKLGGANELNVGDLMIEAMRENHSLDWQFVDSAQGESGLASGEYYAEFILPASFTEDFLGVLGGELERPTIECWLNERYSASALNATDAGVGVVEAVVNRVFTEAAADALAGVVQDVASGLVSDGSAANSAVRTGIDGATNDLKVVMSNLDRDAGAIDQWRTMVSSTKEDLDALKKAVPNLRDAIADGEKTLSDARTSSHEAAGAYSSVLSQGGKELAGVLNDVAGKVSKAASTIAEKQSDLDAALEKATKALDESERLIETLRKADPQSSAVSSLEKENKKLQDEVAELEELSAAVGDAAADANDAAKALAGDVKKTTDDLKDRNDTFNSDTLPKIDTSLDAIALVMGSLDGALGSLDAQIDQAKALIDQIDSVLQRTQEALATTAESLGKAREGLVAARSDLAATANSRSVREFSKLANVDAKSYDALALSPVSTEVKQVYSLNSYGAGVSPFYTCLAIWIACCVLIVVLKPEVVPERFPEMRPWQGYAGRLMLFCLLALLQGVAVTAGDLMLGVQAVGPVSLVVAGLLVAFCFINIVYALAITFKHVGKALAVVLLVVQIPVVSGMFPSQLLPDFFQAMYSWLPLAYGIDAMREAVGGYYDVTYLRCLTWLFACGLATLALAILVRPRVRGLNRLFDRGLAGGDLFIADALPEEVEDSEDSDERAVRLLRHGGPARQTVPIVPPIAVAASGEFDEELPEGEMSFTEVFWGGADFENGEAFPVPEAVSDAPEEVADNSKEITGELEAVDSAEREEGADA